MKELRDWPEKTPNNQKGLHKMPARPQKKLVERRLVRPSFQERKRKDFQTSPRRHLR